MAFVFRNPITITPVGAIVRVTNMKDVGGVEGGWSVQGGRTYSVSLRVETNNAYVGPLQVIRSLNLKMGDYYQFPMLEFNGDPAAPVGAEKDTGSFLNSVSARRESEDALSWVVTMDFNPYDLVHELGDEATEDGSANPLNMRPKVSWGGSKFEVARARDLDGKPFINTANEPLEDVPKFEETRPLLTITRNEETFNAAYANQFKDTVNQDTFLGYPPNTVKCKDIVGERDYHADWGYFWEIKYEFEIRDDTATDGDGWTTVLTNIGFRELVGSTPTEVIIGGKPVSEPVLLNEAGRYVPGADPHYLEFRVYESVDFGQLNIPEDILTQTT